MMPSSGEALLIRADANTQIGTGHVMRCLALAQAWQDAGGHVIFLLSHVMVDLEERLRDEGMEVNYLKAPPTTIADAEQTADQARNHDAYCVVLDGYDFRGPYQQVIKKAGFRLMVIDDNGENGDYYADIVLNHNLYAREELYASRSDDTGLLLGSRYVLLRKEFLEWKGWKRVIPEHARNLLVTFGGSDPCNITLQVLRELNELKVEEINVKVVVGPANRNARELYEYSRTCWFPCELSCSVRDMSAMMAWADVAIAAAGVTCWEMAFMGVPALLMVVAENQMCIAQSLSEEKACMVMGQPDSIVDLTNHMINSGTLRRSMSERGQTLIDANGSTRVVNCILGNDQCMC